MIPSPPPLRPPPPAPQPVEAPARELPVSTGVAVRWAGSGVGWWVVVVVLVVALLLLGHVCVRVPRGVAGVGCPWLGGLVGNGGGRWRGAVTVGLVEGLPK